MLWVKFGDRRSLVDGLEMLGSTVRSIGRSAGAARMWGAAERLRGEIGYPMSLSPSGWQEIEPDVTAARADLGDAGYDAEFARGRSLALDEAMREALGQ